ncbi:sensor histidine kinase [Lutibacter sp. HS1-25]|uniref:sensor histidine kinase n=1 Tax=Lutibacter sp. HS1-25 TaxID=2485000 RepID=UPI0010104165|nr:HAMP domain-containing sensor histidine kinase [Lutibacter sp. HS1-25]RXP60343.1 sensor histidine kinase [Lutibacter sp. HS1-25]
MDKQNYKWVVYFIGLTIVITIAAQVYWNIKEYETNKQQLISKVQRSLDNAVETYFANLTKSGIITYPSLNPKNSNDKTDTIVVRTNSRENFRKKMDSTLQNLTNKDSSKSIIINNEGRGSFAFFNSERNVSKNIDSLISKVIISISRDTLDLNKLDSYLIDEFERNNIEVTYGLKYDYSYKVNHDSIVKKNKDLNLDKIPKKHLTAISNSTFLPHRSHLELYFTNETATLLKNTLISILLSFLLSISIIASLVYLLKTIYKQKQLAEVKNDLINNITHEFKTPIATISTVLEAMKNFNVLDDKEKSTKYIDIANLQVEKLHQMVEKILETATLNNNNLELHKKPENVPELIQRVVEKYKLIANEKAIIFNNLSQNIIVNLDVFHFENALGNIIDNAIKYGGDIINIELISTKNKVEILIKDNGNGISKSQKEKVFEQFYRIPTGNTHNVKGFGIGLFYSKSIVEKHQGNIEIIYDKNNNTIFKIELLNEQ